MIQFLHVPPGCEIVADGEYYGTVVVGAGATLRLPALRRATTIDLHSGATLHVRAEASVGALLLEDPTANVCGPDWLRWGGRSQFVSVGART